MDGSSRDGKPARPSSWTSWAISGLDQTGGAPGRDRGRAARGRAPEAVLVPRSPGQLFRGPGRPARSLPYQFEISTLALGAKSMTKEQLIQNLCEQVPTLTKRKAEVV